MRSLHTYDFACIPYVCVSTRLHAVCVRARNSSVRARVERQSSLPTALLVSDVSSLILLTSHFHPSSFSSRKTTPRRYRPPHPPPSSRPSDDDLPASPQQPHPPRIALRPRKNRLEIAFLPPALCISGSRPCQTSNSAFQTPAVRHHSGELFPDQPPPSEQLQANTAL